MPSPRFPFLSDLEMKIKRQQLISRNRSRFGQSRQPNPSLDADFIFLGRRFLECRAPTKLPCEDFGGRSSAADGSLPTEDLQTSSAHQYVFDGDGHFVARAVGDLRLDRGEAGNDR